MIKRHLSLLPLSLCLAILLIASSVPAQLSFTKTNCPAGIYPHMVSIADFNGDGHDDLAVTNNYWDEQSAKGVTILLNDGSGDYGAPVTYPTGESADDLHVGDLNGDGHPDVAVVSRIESKLTLLLNDGHGAFTITDDYDIPGSDIGVRIADFDGDGKPDVVTGGVVVMINNGDGTLADGVDYDAGSMRRLEVGDVNNDGYPDIAVTNRGANSVSLLLNNGDGTFAPKAVYPTGAFANHVIIDDLDGDGWKDLAVTNRNDNTVSVLRNNGNGTFAAQVVYPMSASPDVLAVGDLDGDSYADLVVVDESFNGGITVLLNNGNGTFRPGTTLGGGEGSRVGVDIADINGDGRNDIVASLAGLNMVSVFLNTSELPVTLTAFQAIAHEQSALLTWSTSEEVNFSHFEIQRSADGRLWQRVGEVAAAGLGDAPLAYRYSDVQPLPGLSYYRLKMIDLDGTYVYSDIRSVVSRAAPALHLEVYPNPASDRVSLTTSGAVSEIRLRDLSGRLLRKISSYEKEKGIPVSGLGAGVVLVEVRYADGTVKVGRVVTAR